MSALSWVPMAQINLKDLFFDSLRNDYPGFDTWFTRKVQAGEYAYVFKQDNQNIDGFLYLKQETESVEDVVPPLCAANRLKIGTFKVNPHSTRLGERLMKKAFDHAVARGVDELYVTVFPKHGALVDLFVKYGFNKVAVKPNGNSNVEDVLVRSLQSTQNDVVKDYPLIRRTGRNFILAIYPYWHTRLLPDSRLCNESSAIVEDFSHTNSIHKVYLTKMNGTGLLRRGDVLAIYRTTDGNGPAHYRSVITSICVVEEVRDISSFQNSQDFLRYCEPYSIFNENEIKDFWNTRRYPTIIRFTYNAALQKRLTRGNLIESHVIDPNAYVGFMPLNNQQLNTILQLGGINARLIVDPA